MLIKRIKSIIKDLARNAVLIAEKEYGSGQGEIKKQKAINYVIDNLPFSPLCKRIIAIVLSKIIDEFVEASVDWLHNMPNEQGD